MEIRDGHTYDSGRERFAGPALESWEYGEIPLVSSCSPTDDVLSFSMQLYDNQIARFAQNPIRVELEIMVKNPLWRPGAPVQKYVPYDGTHKDAPFLFIDSLAPFYTLFDNLEIYLDDQEITVHSLYASRLSGFASHMEKSHLSNAERSEYCDAEYYVKDKTDRYTESNVDHKKALRAVRGASSWCISADGYPFLGPPDSFIVSKLEGRKPRLQSSFLPPRTKILVRMKRASPSGHALENIAWERLQGAGANARALTDNDGDYFSTGAIDDGKWSEDYWIKIKDINLAVEVCTIDKNSPAYNRLMKFESTIFFPFDYYKFYTQNAMAGGRYTEAVAEVAPRTPLVGFNFFFADAAFFNKTNSKPTSYRGWLPKEVKRMTFQLNGRTLFFPKGLSSLLGVGNRSKLVHKQYQKYLKMRNILDRKAGSPLPSLNSYRIYIPIDLTAFPDGGRMSVKVEFTDDSCPQGLHTLLYTAERGAITRVVKNKIPEWSFVESTRV